MDKHRLKQYAKKIREDSEELDRRLIARVAGVTFEGRQELLSQIDRDTPIILERDRRNPHDFHAVKVMAGVSRSWEHVGFLPRAMARLVSKSLDQGVSLSASVHRRTGGMVNELSGETLNYGLEILINPER